MRSDDTMRGRLFSLPGGAKFFAVPTDRFKCEYFSCRFQTPIRPETVQKNTLLLSVLRRGTAKFPDQTALSRHLDFLYSSAVRSVLSTRGDMQTLGFSADFLGEDYVEGKEIYAAITALCASFFTDPAMEDGHLRADHTETEKRNMIDAIRAKINNPRALCAAKCREILYSGEPAALDLLGEEETVSSIDAEILTARLRALRAENMPDFFYVGNSDPQRIAAVLEETFLTANGFSGQRNPMLAVTKSAPQKAVYATEKTSLSQGKLTLGFRADIGDRHPLSPAIVVLNELYGGSPASKLFLHVREDKGLCYQCSSGADRTKGAILAAAGMKPENRQVTEDAMLAEFAALARGEIGDTEWEAARLSLANAFLQYEDNPAALCAFYAGRIASDDDETIEEWRERVMRVTREEVVEAARAMRLGAVYYLDGCGSEEATE